MRMVIGLIKVGLAQAVSFESFNKNNSLEKVKYFTTLLIFSSKNTLISLF